MLGPLPPVLRSREAVQGQHLITGLAVLVEGHWLTLALTSGLECDGWRLAM